MKAVTALINVALLSRDSITPSPSGCGSAARGRLHPRRIIRQPFLRGAKPAHWRIALAELGSQIDLGMAVTVIARHRGRCAAIELADRAVGDAEDRGMHEGRVIAIAFVLQDEFPVGLDAMLEEPCRHLDLAFRREPNQTVDGLGRAAEMLL